MYVPDSAVDAAIAKNQTLQEVIQGRTLMLWRPGTTATVAAQCCLMFGGISLLGSALWLAPITADRFKYGFFFGLLPLAGVTAGLFHCVVRGWTHARTFTYRFALGMTALAACCVLNGVIRWRLVSLASASFSVLFHLGAVRLIAGEGYAIASAMFRAQRAHARQMKLMAREPEKQK